MKKSNLPNLLLQVLLLTVFVCAFISPENVYAREMCEWWNHKNITVNDNAVKTNATAEASHDELKRKAIEKARPKLIESLTGIRISAKNIVSKEQATSVAAIAKPLEEQIDPNGSIQIAFGVPVYGDDSLAKFIFQEKAKRSFIEPSKPSQKIEGDYTSLIIDCTKWEDSNKDYLNPVMIPEIKDDAGRGIYGGENIDYDIAVNKGYVQYASDIKHSEAGDKPLIIQAIGIADELGNPVISIEDADKILSENKAAHFLDNASVIVVSRSVKLNQDDRGTGIWGARDSSGYGGKTRYWGSKG